MNDPFIYEPELDTQQVKTQANPQVKAQVKPRVPKPPRPQVRPQVKPRVELQVKPQVKSQVKPRVKPQMKPQVNSKPKVNPFIHESKPKSNPELLKNTQDSSLQSPTPLQWFLLSVCMFVPFLNIGMYVYLFRKCENALLKSWCKGTCAFVIAQAVLYVIFIILCITAWHSLDPAYYTTP